jgi:glycosyltransferase involved in cell wall biosynthesis
MPSGRIGVISFDWYPFEVRALRLSETVAAAGYDVDVICLLRPGEKRYEVRNGIHIYRIPVNRNFGGSLAISLLSWCQFLFLASITVTRLHLRHTYDLIHVHNIPDFLVFSTIFSKLLGAKIILDVQDVTPELMAAKSRRHLRRIMTRLAIWQEHISTAFVHHVVTTGRPFAELLLQRGVPPEKLTIILNSAYPPFFPASRRPPPPTETDGSKPFILMYHGTLAEGHGLETAIRALALARHTVPHLRLDIKGLGNYLPFLKKLAVELGVSEYVVFSKPSLNIVDFVVHGDIGIIPYRCNGFMELLLPTKAYEFAWMHRPIIASNTPAMRSMFRSESVAFCDPYKPESFAEAIIDLYQHPEKRASMIANAAEDYEPYRWELMAERYQQLLASLNCKQAPEKQTMTISRL